MHMHMKIIFKPGAPASSPACAWLLKITLCRHQYVCLCPVCVHPEAINSYSCEIKPELSVKQVIVVSGFYIQHLSALVMKHTYLKFLLKKAKVRLY